MQFFDSELAMPRRRFLRAFAMTSATGWLRGGRMTTALLADIQPATTAGAALLLVRVSDHPALQNDFGSVRIGTSAIQSDHFPSGLFYPVLINRGLQGRFYALDAQCSHAGCTVPVLDASQKFSECPCHGSRYGVDGRLLRGPAGFPLRQFALQFDGRDQLAIALDNVQGLDGFTIAVRKALSFPDALALSFLAFQNIAYEVWSRRSTGDPWEPAPFALDPQKQPDQTVFHGQDDYATLYVTVREFSRIYAIVMRTDEV